MESLAERIYYGDYGDMIIKLVSVDVARTHSPTLADRNR